MNWTIIRMWTRREIHSVALERGHSLRRDCWCEPGMYLLVKDGILWSFHRHQEAEENS